MNDGKNVNFEEITERIDNIIDMADDKSLIDSYRTLDLLKLVREEFQEIISNLNSQTDNDLYKDTCL